jgi:threonylcarbamoyladenosine tRNA methylthiotransferase MtaB
VASTFHIENFGCRAARADGEAVAALLRKSGAAESHSAQADVVIVNTCSVTAEADREARAWIRRAHRQNPEARIIATGCYAQRAPDELASLPGVAAVVGNSHKALAPEIALQLTNQRASGLDFSGADKSSFNEHPALTPADAHSSQFVSIRDFLASSTQPLVLADDTFAHSFLEEAPITPGAQTRPNLKIQEGCSNRCSFCVIPQTRGHSRSLSPSAVLNHVRSFVEGGGNELVLSGINLGRWGRDLHRSTNEPGTLAALVRAIFDQTALPRLRLSSIEPMDWDGELISVVREFAGTHAGSPATGLGRLGVSRLARHAHLPLQSGSDSVLRRMHRRYRPWHYAEKIAELARAAGPAITFGADVMVGFPGETDREFQESYDFIQSLPLGYLHLFPFSPRPGTRAWALHAESPVPAAVLDQRMAALRTLAADKVRSHRLQFIGAEFKAITLHTSPALAASRRTSALTDNFVPVELDASLPANQLPANQLPANQLVQIRITGIAADNTLL